MAFPLLALLLLAQDAPVATAKAHVPPHAPVAAAAAPASNQTAADGELLPQGAPSDDYGFVAWCDGVLAGHMDIAERVKDVLPIDDVQQKVGKSYLRAYVRALDGSAEGKTEEGRRRAEQLRQDGWSKWDQARAADHTLAAETYLSYQLPGRCEHAAVRLSKNPNLFKLTPSVDDVGTVRTAMRGSANDAAASTIPAASRPFMKAAAAGAAPAKAAAKASPPAGASETVATAIPVRTSAGAPTADTPAAAAIAMLPAQPKPIPAPTSTTMGAPSEAPANVAAEPLATSAAAPAAVPATTVAPPAKAVAKTQAAEDKRIVKMPQKGHLLPPFLRKKDKDEDS